jgi:hypothetical protein
MSQQRLGRWATEAKAHLLKYRPEMATELERQGKLDDSARKAADRAADQYALGVENGMFPLEAESKAKGTTCSCRSRKMSRNLVWTQTD